MENRERRIEVAQENLHINTPDPPLCKYYTKFELKEFRRGPPTTIRVVPEDSLEAAMNLRKEDLYPLVLNMACHVIPGGGWLKGAGAQEETLFYRTNYWKSLDQEYYPIMDTEAIISEHVNVIRDNDLNLLPKDKRWHCSFLAVAAIKNPGRNSMKNEHYRLTKAKIELIFRVGIKHKYDSLVLSAFGCGAYNNPPKIIINIFNDMLKKYNGYFKNITFAIIPQERESKMYSGSIDKCNYTLFKEYINTNPEYIYSDIRRVHVPKPIYYNLNNDLEELLLELNL